MAIVTKHTAATGSQKPSVLETLIMGGIGEAPLVSMAKSKNITNYVHSWFNDTYRDAKDNAHLELGTLSEPAKHTAYKSMNITQLIKNSVRMSQRQMDTQLYYTKDEYARQVAKVGKEHVKDIEFAILGLGRDTIFDEPKLEADRDASRMGSLFNLVPTENRHELTGDFTYEQLQQVLLPIWRKQGLADGKYKLFCGSKIKEMIDRWVRANPSLKVEVRDNTLDQTTSKIITNFGIVNIVLHPSFDNPTLENRFLAGNLDGYSLAFLHNTEFMDKKEDEGVTAKTGEYYTDVTIELTNQFHWATASVGGV